MLQEIQVRGGVKKRPHPSGGVWIFSGITHCLLLLLLIGFVRKKSTPLKERKGPKKDHFC